MWYKINHESSLAGILKLSQLIELFKKKITPNNDEYQAALYKKNGVEEYFIFSEHPFPILLIKQQFGDKYIDVTDKPYQNDMKFVEGMQRPNF